MLRMTLERKRLGISQAELARRAVVNQTSISKIESGKEPAYPKRGARIAAALGWEGSLDELFSEVTEEMNE